MPIRDSLSRCDANLYSNIYEVRRHPDFKPEAISATQPIHKDTIQLSRDKLQKEALSRLRHTSKYLIVQQGFMRIGKYLFLAVALPPYLTIYRIPKWILVEALPFIFSMFSSRVEKINQKMKRRIEIVIQKMAQMIYQIQKTLHTLIQPIIRVVLEIRSVFQKTRQNLAHLFNRIRGKDKRSSSSSPIINVFRRIQENFRRIQQKLGHQAASFGASIRQSFLQLKLIPQKLIKQGKSLKSHLKEHSFSRQFLAKIKLSQHLATQTTDWLCERWNRFFSGMGWIGQWLKKLYERYIQFYIQPLLKGIQSKVKSISFRLSYFFSRKYQHLMTSLQSRQNRLGQLTASQIFSSLSTKLSFSWIPESVQRLNRQIFWNYLTENALNVVLKGITSTYSFLLTGLEKGLNLIKTARQSVSQRLNHFKEFIFSAFQKGKNYSKLSLTFSGKGCRKIVYTLCVTTVMCGILAVWSVQLLRQVSNQLMLSLKR